MEVKKSGIESTSGRFLLDDGETGDAVERIGLYSEPGIGDLMTAAGTDTVRTCMQGCERLLDLAELFDGQQLYGQGDIGFMFGGGLVDRIGEELRLCCDQMGHRSFVCEHHSKPIEFVLKIREIRVLPHGDTRVFRRNNSLDYGWMSSCSASVSPPCGHTSTPFKATEDHQQINFA